ncbi:MAG: SGNH/GDSL hydrolase family protein [Deltaproteobacteria bacterium]|nr:SGNH/GDSL hydrolase family protein [Deltaproteobacteria bacterium]
MNTRSLTRSFLVALSFVAVSAVVACSSGSGDGAKRGSGGGSAGEQGSGGSAGDPGMGGAAAGNDGQGGSSETGGISATGGAPAGTGGTPAGTGGTPAPGGAVCPASGNCTMLAVGDGLAAGVGAPPGYLKFVSDYLKTKKKTGFEWVGSKTSGGLKHEGVDKALSSAVLGTIEATIKATMPNIVVLNVGSEDAQQSMQAGLAARIKQIIEKIRAARPGTYVLVTGLSRTPDTKQFDSKAVPTYVSSAFTTRAFTGEKEIEAVVDAMNDMRVRFIRFNFAPQYAAGTAGKPAPVAPSYFVNGTYNPNTAGYTNMAKLAIAIALTPIIHH